MTDIFKRGFINLNFYKAIYCHLKYTINVSRGKVFPSDEWHMKLFPESYPEGREQFYRIKKIQLGVHGGVLLISLLSGMWIIPLIFSFSKFFGGSWLHQLCNHAQHSGLPESIPDFRLSCRTITLSPFVQFLYWHMNFHIEHHMFAAVPCYNLKKCHDLIKNDCPKPYNGLVETWVNMINIQRKMDEDENYRHMPELPTEANPARMKELESNTPLYDVDGITPLQKSTPPGDASFKIWECSVCAFIYDEARGLPEEGLAPGTRWDDIPDDWECPDCGVAKSKFKMIEVAAQPIDSTNILE
jgi:rubredoxin